MTRDLLVRCRPFGALEISVDDAGLVVSAPVVLRRFLRQPAESLYRWLQKYGAFSVEIVRQQTLGLFDGAVATPGAPGKDRA